MYKTNSTHLSVRMLTTRFTTLSYTSLQEVADRQNIMNLGRQIISSMCFCTYTKQAARNLSHRQSFHISATTLSSSKQYKYYSIDGGTNSHKLSLTTKTTKDWSRSKKLDASISGFAVFGATLLAYSAYTHINRDNVVLAETSLSESSTVEHLTVRKDMPTYRMDEVAKHVSIETGIWVTYGIGVYDITKFVPEHPGSDKIMMGAGAAIDPFWHIFQQHNQPAVLELLETFRIGNLNPDDDVGTKDLFDPWSNEPKRHPLLRSTSQRPYNAEPPASILVDSFVTPVEFFYVRNHLPVPEVDIAKYELVIDDEASGKSKTLRFEDVKRLPKHSITAAIMCGGNRRSEMHKVKPVRGLHWGAAAVGNAVWSGPKLCDILYDMGVKNDDTSHVHFEGLDMDVSASPYAASIPLYKAMDPRCDVILAFEMNGEPLNRDHGYPIRVIVPGTVGARNVKWLGRIVIAPAESDSHWQQGDYKGFSPSTDWDTVDFSKSPAIQNMPVTSAICQPQPGEVVRRDGHGNVVVKGYAWSGGGAKIVRVDVTGNAGQTWQVAELEGEESERSSLPNGRNWSWTLWTAHIPVANDTDEVEIWSKAVDANYNVQPESFLNTWNLRGVLSNAYCKVKVKIT